MDTILALFVVLGAMYLGHLWVTVRERRAREDAARRAWRARPVRRDWRAKDLTRY